MAFLISINLEHTSEMATNVKLSHENSYPQRAEKYREIEINIKE
jgi:CRISPR-associated exonuclease Cas4